MPYLTPDTPPAGTICRTIVIPDDLQWKAIVNGALSELFKAYNFEQFGSLTPQETADIFLDMWTNFHDSECQVLPIGMVAAFTADDRSVPAKWLFCDGSAISRTTYAALFAIVGTRYGVGNGSTTFNIPDLRNRFIYGVINQTSANPGFTGGEASHVLDINEMPAHDHNITKSSAAGTTTVRAADGTATSAGAQTSTSTGGGAAHNNMPPYMQLMWGIYAGV